MIVLPTLRQLRYLVAVVEIGHFGRAAEACFVTQSTLSTAIRELETILGQTLIERTKRHVSVTPLGLEVAERAKMVLRDVGDIVELAQATGGPLSGLIRLGAIPTIGPYLIPSMMREVRNSYPDAQFYLHEGKSDDLLAAIAEVSLDLALLAFPYETPGMEQMEIMRDRFWLAVPEKHGLARRKQVMANDLDGSEMLLLEEGHCLRDHALAACRVGDVPKGEQIQATTLLTAVEMVAEGIGMTLVPEIAVNASFVKSAPVSVLPVKAANASRQIGLVWRRGAVRKQEFRLFGHFLKNWLANR